MDTASAALGFDPSISSQFYVFQLVQMLDYNDFFVRAVEVYSSRSGRWLLSEIELTDDMSGEMDYIRYAGKMTFFKGFLHFCIRCDAVVSVDTEGKTWKISRLPHRQHEGWMPGFSVCHSQGRLLYVDSNSDAWPSDVMSIYVLEDLDSEEWTWVFKQSINKVDLFGPRPRMPGIWDYYTAAFHPDSDLVFFFHWSKHTLVSYDMEHRDVHVICTLAGPYFELLEIEDVHRPFLPYVPLYTRALPSAKKLHNLQYKAQIWHWFLQKLLVY